MGVAAAYLGELVTDELKSMAAEDKSRLRLREEAGKGGNVRRAATAAGGGGSGRVREAEPTRIVVVAPQEGQVREGGMLREWWGYGEGCSARVAAFFPGVPWCVILPSKLSFGVECTRLVLSCLVWSSLCSGPSGMGFVSTPAEA